MTTRTKTEEFEYLKNHLGETLIMLMFNNIEGYKNVRRTRGFLEIRETIVSVL